MAVDPIEEAQEKIEHHNPLYWFGINTANAMKKCVKAHLLIFKLAGVITLISAFVLRSLIHPFFISLRIHTFDILLIAAFVAVVWLFRTKFVERGRRLSRFWKFAVFVGVVVLLRVQVYDYIGRYCRCVALNEIDLNELPTTDHERIQPLVSLRQLAIGKMDQNLRASDPDFVRIGNDFRFTMALEPDTTLGRLEGTISEVIDIPGSVASPDFSSQNRRQVKFAIGEQMLLGKNSYVATVKALGFFRYWSYQPTSVRYITNDKGEMIQVVSLMRLGGSWWSRWIFPWPEFGGVHIIHQREGSVGHTIWRIFFGEGDWVKPEDVHKYSYLTGQNLIPYEVSRYAAESFRFDKGFFGPMLHIGDTMIPDLPSDENPMPFTIYAKFGNDGDEKNKLYHYFALEPRQNSQHGLAVSLFFPADGIGRPFAYRHYVRDKGLIGVAAVDTQVRGSDIHVDWSHARPVEHRPWIHDVQGLRRLMWLSTIITYGEGKGAQTTASSMPSTVLTDARTGQSIWVNARYPEGWVSEIQKVLEQKK